MPYEDAVSVAQLADLFGLSTRTVKELAADGVFPRLGRGRYDLKAAVRNYTARLRDAAALRGGDDATAAARRREAEARAEKVELANAKARGDMVSREAVAVTWIGIVTDTRSALLAVPARIPELPKDIALRVDEEIRAALERLAADA